MLRLRPWLVLILLLAAGRAGAVSVAVTVKPLHSIVASVMQDVATPVLLLDGTVSPHIDRIKPSTLRKIRSVDLLVWIGPGLESFLAPAVAELPESVQVLAAASAPLPALLEVRDGHEHHQHSDEAPTDPHLWLDPVNAAAIAMLVAEMLSEMDRDNADVYLRNASRFTAEMSAVESFAQELLSQSGDKAFILFHDFFQYFEDRFGLLNAGVVTFQPQITPSARHLRALNQIIVEREVDCILTEPQFEGRALKSLETASTVHTAVVDPLASSYDAGQGLYALWFKDMASAIHRCLSG